MNPTPDEWEYWYGPWRRIQCARCRAITLTSAACTVCGLDCSAELENATATLHSGQEIRVASAFLGADEWTQYSLLRLMYDEWQRPIRGDVLQEAPADRRASPRLVIVLLFWTHIEVLVERLLQRAAARLPAAVQTDLLGRYSSVGGRMDRLSRILLGAPTFDELERLGRGDVATHLRRVQIARNAFIHGQAEIITDGLVRDTVDMLPRTQLAWIELYNSVCSRIWQGLEAGEKSIGP